MIGQNHTMYDDNLLNKVKHEFKPSEILYAEHSGENMKNTISEYTKFNTTVIQIDHTITFKLSIESALAFNTYLSFFNNYSSISFVSLAKICMTKASFWTLTACSILLANKINDDVRKNCKIPPKMN